MMIPLKLLEEGRYYIGVCRNAGVARWNGERFVYWRRKFGRDHLTSLPHILEQPSERLDAFVPYREVGDWQVREVPLDQPFAHDG